ncbi:MAG: sigma-54-dependent Fis family transcriptional regulator [Legionellales bacterium]|nr:sigma-54-dependent Fis family transcriptional regulator [Legionellales bacterium]
MEKIKVLIVDDEPDIRELTLMTLSNMQLAGVGAESIEQAKKILAQEQVDICLTDMRLLDGDGISLVTYIQKHYEHIPVAVITAFGNMELAVNALKAGAFDFVSKPVDIQLLKNLIHAAEKQVSTKPLMANQVQLLGDSSAIIQIKSLALKVAKSQAPVMIFGDSGTGKELLAKYIHENSARREKPFVPVNCGAIPTELVESEFFGYKKGSFTGAHTDKQGLFQTADGGTLFLDEIAELPVHLQVKLLRAIQEKNIRPLGAQQEILIDVRIISATHKDLLTEVQSGTFRQDLYYRLNVIALKMPKLTDHIEDLPILVKNCLVKLAKELDVELPSLSANALTALKKYNFPGNVRELENILSRAVTLCDNNHITEEDLALPSVDIGTSNAMHLDDNDKISTKLDLIEKDMILKALDEHKWNRTKTAQSLGITLRALRYRLKKWDIE